MTIYMCAYLLLYHSSYDVTNPIGRNSISAPVLTNGLGRNLISILGLTYPLGRRLISALVLTSHLKCQIIFLILAALFFNGLRLLLFSLHIHICLLTSSVFKFCCNQSMLKQTYSFILYPCLEIYNL